jgi:hypothetical protein
MVKLERNRRASVLLARVLLVCSFFAVGLAPSAKADEYQYTVSFAGASSFDLGGATVTFDTSSIINGPTVIDPSSVQVLEAPQGDSLVSLFLNAGDFFSMSFFAPCGTTYPNSRPCTNIANQNNEYDSYQGSFFTPVTAPGTYSFDEAVVEEEVIGGTILQDGGVPATLTLVATPEPNSGLMFGACFLLCAAIALRRRLPSSWRTIPKIL